MSDNRYQLFTDAGAVLNDYVSTRAKATPVTGPTPCVCGHDPDEHHDVHGCLADRFGASGYPCQCLCATYEADEADR